MQLIEFLTNIASSIRDILSTLFFALSTMLTSLFSIVKDIFNSGIFS